LNIPVERFLIELGGRRLKSVIHELERKNGAGDRDRTGDIQLGKLAFYR
jgi:hypothetical protein